jgi:hypothetical protein
VLDVFDAAGCWVDAEIFSTRTGLDLKVIFDVWALLQCDCDTARGEYPPPNYLRRGHN